jgi:hypothetical protein
LEVSDRRKRRVGGGAGGVGEVGSTINSNSSHNNNMGRKKIQISRITDERNRQVKKKKKQPTEKLKQFITL